MDSFRYCIPPLKMGGFRSSMSKVTSRFLGQQSSVWDTKKIEAQVAVATDQHASGRAEGGLFFTVEMRWSRMTFRFFWGVENIKHSSFLVAMFHSRCKTSGWSFHFLKNRSMIHLGQLPDFPKWVTFLVFFHCPIRFGRQKPCFILA